MAGKIASSRTGKAPPRPSVMAPQARAPSTVATGKPREPRREVLLRGRMQAGGSWVDVTVHNVSSRGLMAQSALRLERGGYVEIRYRSQVIIGRVVWTNRGRFGLRTRDAINIPDLLGEPVPADFGERRHRPRIKAPERRKRSAAERYLASRQLSSIVQFIGLAIVTAAAALVLAEQVHSLLASPLAVARAAMSYAEHTDGSASAN